MLLSVKVCVLSPVTVVSDFAFFARSRTSARRSSSSGPRSSPSTRPSRATWSAAVPLPPPLPTVAPTHVPTVHSRAGGGAGKGVRPPLLLVLSDDRRRPAAGRAAGAHPPSPPPEIGGPAPAPRAPHSPLTRWTAAGADARRGRAHRQRADGGQGEVPGEGAAPRDPCQAARSVPAPPPVGRPPPLPPVQSGHVSSIPPY